MSFIPEDEVGGGKTQSLAPMIDFLFLMLMFFASLAISRVTLQETEIDLVEVQSTPIEEVSQDEHFVINIAINSQGEYKWVTDIRDYAMDTPEAISSELVSQHSSGLLPDNKANTDVLLKIDKSTPWEPILKLIFAVRDAGFPVYPLYLPAEPEISDGAS